MSRMREAMRSGWKSSKSSRPSPVDANMTGLPVTDATESAAPPRASPSSLDSTMPVKLTPSSKAMAVLTASWPIIESITKRTSFGTMARRIWRACSIMLGVDAEAAGGVHDHDVVQRAPRFLDAGAGDGDRVTGGLVQLGGGGARVRGEDGHAGALADDLELRHGVGALQVAGDQHRAVALGLEPLGQLAGQRGLTRALEAGEHDDGGAGLGQPDPAGFAAEDLDEFLVDDLDDLLARVQRAGDLGAERPLAHAGGELPDHRHGDVGVQQGTPDLADRGVNVRLGEAALATEVLEGCCQPVRE